jgi:hypothetical protein
VIGNGCVYPSRTRTIANQLTAAGDTWKAYVAGLPQRSRTACRYPTLGSDDALLPRPGDPYVTWRNPFVYFRSLIGGTACRKNDVGIGQLATDLRTTRTTPSLSYIVPDPCNDGDPQPCRPKAPSGLPAAEHFLRSVVPEIERSAAYTADGLIAITFDQAPQTGPQMDPSSCCDNPSYPNLPTTSGSSGPGTATTTIPTTTPTAGTPTTGTTTTGTTTIPSTGTTTAPTTGTATTGTTTAPTTGTPTTGTTTPTTPTAPTTGTSTTTTPTLSTTTPTTTTPTSIGDGETNPTGGGGHVGLLLISRYVKPGSVDVIGYFNHFSLLASIEDLFNLGHLGYATDPALPVFDASVFNAKPK